jgi:hypothetical protein
LIFNIDPARNMAMPMVCPGRAHAGSVVSWMIIIVTVTISYLLREK